MPQVLRAKIKSVEKTEKQFFTIFQLCISGSTNPRNIIFDRLKLLLAGH